MPPDAVLACTVRACGEPLARSERTWTCPRGHSYDVARGGYVNLLQPNDRRSREAGDSRAAVEARARLQGLGAGGAAAELVLEHVRRAVAAAPTGAPAPHVVELGSGTGALLARIARELGLACTGIDLSAPAIELAARRHRDAGEGAGPTWVIANADRRLPVVTGSVAVVLSIHGRRAPSECARVLREGGTWLVAVPAEDDLRELREAVQGRAFARERATELRASLAPWFEVAEESEARERIVLPRPALLDVLASTYRGFRRGDGERVAALDSLAVTFASTLFVCRRAPGISAASPSHDRAEEPPDE